MGYATSKSVWSLGLISFPDNYNQIPKALFPFIPTSNSKKTKQPATFLTLNYASMGDGIAIQVSQSGGLHKKKNERN